MSSRSLQRSRNPRDEQLPCMWMTSRSCLSTFFFFFWSSSGHRETSGALLCLLRHGREALLGAPLTRWQGSTYKRDGVEQSRCFYQSRVKRCQSNEGINKLINNTWMSGCTLFRRMYQCCFVSVPFYAGLGNHTYLYIFFFSSFFLFSGNRCLLDIIWKAWRVANDIP